MPRGGRGPCAVCSTCPGFPVSLLWRLERLAVVAGGFDGQCLEARQPRPGGLGRAFCVLCRDAAEAAPSQAGEPVCGAGEMVALGLQFPAVLVELCDHIVNYFPLKNSSDVL